MDHLVAEVHSGTYTNEQGMAHQFADGQTLNIYSDFATIESAIASGGAHYFTTGGYFYYDTHYRWVSAENVETIEYHGAGLSDLFLDWNGNMTAAYGGAGTDVLYADWSTTTSAIVWNLTVNNDAEKTLGNGVVVQSIERLLLRTGSSNDHLVLGDQRHSAQSEKSALLPPQFCSHNPTLYSPARNARRASSFKLVCSKAKMGCARRPS